MSICLLSGTPGSGKSLHAASMIYRDLSPHSNKFVICNFQINIDLIREDCRDRFCFIPASCLENTDYLISIIKTYWKSHYALSTRDAEERIHFYWDECQLYLNSRTWLSNQKSGWPSFFQMHRHYGVKIILMCQMLSMLDKQVRGCIEYDIVHRKVANAGAGGYIISRFFGGGLFISLYVWTATRKQFSSEFFLYRRKLGRLYDTHCIIDRNNGFLAPIITIKAKENKHDVKEKITSYITCFYASFCKLFSKA